MAYGCQARRRREEEADPDGDRIWSLVAAAHGRHQLAAFQAEAGRADGGTGHSLDRYRQARPMLIDGRGLGTLVPEDIVWIPAQFDSQVAKIMAQSGDDVKPNSVLMVLTNPDMEAGGQRSRMADEAGAKPT